MPIELPPGTATYSDRNPEPKSFDFFKLAVVLVALLIALIWGLSGASGVIVAWMPPEVEQQLGKAIVPIYEQQAKEGAEQTRLNNLLNQLEKNIPAAKSAKTARDYQILYIDESTVNAAAIPGDRILVYRGLLEQVESENELMMVLGHELGHFTNRDHLRGLGNALLYQIAFSTLFGDVGSILGIGTTMVEQIGKAHFSQQQETQADEVGLDLLFKYYGHAAGATEFFDRIRNRKIPDIQLLASHPAPASRVEHLQKLIRDRNLPIKEKSPLQVLEAKK